MRSRSLALMAAVALTGGPARAQPAAEEEPAPRFPEVLQPPPGFETDAAWAAYDRAFRDAAAGQLSLARDRLEQIIARWPAHPAEAQAEALLDRTDPSARSRRPPSPVARGELVLWSTLGGVVMAASLCEAIACNTDREHAGVYTLTVGSALGFALVTSRRGVQQGEAQLYNSAQTWGALNGLLVNDGAPETAGDAALAIALQVGGLAAGHGIWRAWRPTSGDVALTNTFLLWGSAMATWAQLAADTDPSLRTMLIAGDASLLIGALIAREVHVSRGRTLLIDVGGVLGTLAGSLVALGTNDDQAAGVSFLLGTGAGLALGAAFSSGWDKAPPVRLTPLALPGPGRALGYGLAAGLAF